MDIRLSVDADLTALSQLHLDAFGPEEGPEIARLVDALLEDETARPTLSLVAESDGALTGHVLFTSVRLDRAGDAPEARILSPLGVAATVQKQGVGSRLVHRGLEILGEQGVDLVFVLGHPSYYPRFGFRPAGALGFHAPYPIPEKNAAAWMVRALSPGAEDRFTGTVRCASSLDHAELWVE